MSDAGASIKLAAAVVPDFNVRPRSSRLRCGLHQTELDPTHAVAGSAVNSESLFSAGLSHDELVGVK
jgi:hypothetical protein